MIKASSGFQKSSRKQRCFENGSNKIGNGRFCIILARTERTTSGKSNMTRKQTQSQGNNIQVWTFLAVAVILLAVLFAKSFIGGYVVFSNDGPLGQMLCEQNDIHKTWNGLWEDLNFVGMQYPTPPPSISTGLRFITTPLIYSKFFCPISILILGLSAWFCFSQMKLCRWASLIGALAVMLSSGFFSSACWGVGTTVIAYGMNFCALGLALNTSSRNRIVRLVLAGFCVGIGVMEGTDVGAIFSVVTALAVMCYSLISDGSMMKRVALGFGRVVAIAACAAIIAIYTVSVLVATQIKGVAGMQQDKSERWAFATTWSFPPEETASLIVPGLFGFRMVPKPTDGSDYWGRVGGDPSLDAWFDNGRKGSPPSSLLRFSGGGSYEGILVVLLACWAALQSFRGKNSVFTDKQRKFLWFWILLGTLSLLLSFGRFFEPFYRIVYSLPYFSTIRNPIKFISVFNFSLLMLFAFGVDGLSRRYMETATAGASDFTARLRSWWAKAAAFDRRWIIGCIILVAVSLIGWGIYSSNRPALEQYLDSVSFGSFSPTAVAQFSIAQVGWFVLFLILSVGVIVLILAGFFTGRRAKAGGVLLLLVLVADLARADRPWIYYWDYKQKYESNPIIDFLREKPCEHRVAILPFPLPSQFALFSQLYGIEWKQQQFQYYNIQSLDIVQMPRTPQDIAAYQGVMAGNVKREWELTNTRYLLGPTAILNELNTQLDPEQRRFRIVMTFNIVPKAGIENPATLEELTATSVASNSGMYALFEFTGALPRAKLYTHWTVATNKSAEVSEWVNGIRTRLLEARATEWANALGSLSPVDQATLKELVSDSFKPAQTVLLANPLAASINKESSAVTNASTVEFVSYAPKDVKLKTKSDEQSVLLLNDKYDPSWQVSVDGHGAELLRCNFIMRGVALPPGEHTVEFVFKPDVKTLYISLAAIVTGLSLVGYVGLSSLKHRNEKV